MRQLITRLEDQLLAKLERRAAAEGRSINALVNDILASQVDGGSPKAELRLRGGADEPEHSELRARILPLDANRLQ